MYNIRIKSDGKKPPRLMRVVSSCIDLDDKEDKADATCCEYNFLCDLAFLCRRV